MGLTRWVGETLKYKFITPADLRVGHIALNMRDGNHYRITDRRGRKITTGVHYNEISRSKFIKWMPWTYPKFTYRHDPWFPQMIKMDGGYAWTTNTEKDDTITDGDYTFTIFDYFHGNVVFLSDDGKVATEHRFKAGDPMFVRKIPIVDKD